MKAFPLLAAVVPAVIAGFANTEQNSTTTVGQTITRTATTVYYVTVKPGPVTGDGMACSASGCPIGASTILSSNVTKTAFETLRLTSTTTSVITNVVTPPHATTTVYSDTSSSSVQPVASESSVMTFQTSIPAITYTVSPLPAPAAASEVPSPSRTLEFGALQTLGCYSAPNPLSQDNTDNNQTIEACQSACGNQTWPFMALTDGATCYCGNGLPPSDKIVDDIECNEPCHGDKQQICGGTRYWQIYQLNPHGDIATISNTITKSVKCSTRIVTVYVTGTPDPSTPRYLNTTGMPCRSGWGPSASNGTISHKPIPIITGSLLPVSDSQSLNTPSSSAATTSHAITTPPPVSTPIITSFYGSAGRAKPHPIFTLVARFLAWSILTQAHGLEERLYPYPTHINHSPLHIIGIPSVFRFISEALGPATPESTILVTPTATVSTMTGSLLSSPVLGTLLPAVSTPALYTQAVNGSFSTWWSTSTEPTSSMADGSGSYQPWWTSARGVTEGHIVTIDGTGSNNSSATTTLVVTSTIPTIINATTVMVSTSFSVETKTSTEVVSMTMTSPAFSGPTVSSAAISDVHIFNMGHTGGAVVPMNMLIDCAIFLYILYFM